MRLFLTKRLRNTIVYMVYYYLKKYLPFPHYAHVSFVLSLPYFPYKAFEFSNSIVHIRNAYCVPASSTPLRRAGGGSPMRRLPLN